MWTSLKMHDPLVYLLFLLAGGGALLIINAVTKMIKTARNHAPTDPNSITLKISEAEWRGKVLAILEANSTITQKIADSMEISNKILAELKNSDDHQMQLLMRADRRIEGMDNAVKRIDEIMRKDRKKIK